MFGVQHNFRQSIGMCGGHIAVYLFCASFDDDQCGPLDCGICQIYCVLVWYTAFGMWWHTVTQGGEVKGKLANGVGSQYSHTTSGRSVSSITNADAPTSAASSRLN